jgi:hypothetical protein
MKNLRRQLATASLVAGAIVLGTASSSQAAVLDCSVTAGVCTGGTGTATLNGVTVYAFAGAYWGTTDTQATGSGVIQPFVRVQGNDLIITGMNTSGTLTQDENSSPTFTHDLPTTSVPIVTIGGASYYEFLLDINQTGTDPLLNLSDVDLCSSTAGNRTIASDATSCTPSGPAPNTSTLFYSLGANQVQMNYGFNSGSGSGDLFMYVPVPAGVGSFIYLYSEFGGPTGSANGNNDGYEEWAVRTLNPAPVVPEPTSMLLLGTGLVGLASRARRKNKK